MIRELFISNIENIDSIEEVLIICLEKKYETGEKVHSQDSAPTGMNPEMLEDIRNYIKTGELGNIVLLEKRDLEEILQIRKLLQDYKNTLKKIKNLESYLNISDDE